MDLRTVALNGKEEETFSHGLLFLLVRCVSMGLTPYLMAYMLNECPVSEETQHRK